MLPQLSQFGLFKELTSFSQLNKRFTLPAWTLFWAGYLVQVIGCQWVCWLCLAIGFHLGAPAVLVFEHVPSMSLYREAKNRAIRT